jgi:hypothetical protein
LLSASCQETKSKIDKLSKERFYLINNIEETNRYYVLNTTVDKDSVVLVVFKNSKQLKNIQLAIDEIYKLKTYQYFEVFNLGPDMLHMVDNKEVWSSTDNIGLHFTDGMGNGYLESDEELNYGR